MHEDPFAARFGGATPGPRPTSEAQILLQGLLDELPDQAKALVQRINDEIAHLQEQTEAARQGIREQAEQQVTEIERKADDRGRLLFEQAIDQLEPLQKELFRAGDLGKALAVFLQVRALKARIENVLPDPGNLTQFQQVGKTFRFRVTGSSDGAAWGTDVYTADSYLSTAAVHAGALEAGEEGVVRVSVVSMADVPVRGSFRNGVTSWDWGPYQIGYRVSRA